MFSQVQSKEEDFSKLNLDELNEKLKEAQKWANTHRIANEQSDGRGSLGPKECSKFLAHYESEVRKIESEIQNRTVHQSNNTCKN